MLEYFLKHKKFLEDATSAAINQRKKLQEKIKYGMIDNNNNSNFFYLQVANSPSKPGFKANLSERIIREQIAV